MEFDKTDHSPEKFIFSAKESRIKLAVRKYIYPVINTASTIYYSKKLKYNSFTPDLILYDQRGNDYARHRRRISKYIDLRNKNMLVAGCGSGKDLISWLPYELDSIVGIDLFNYEKSWNKIKSHYRDNNSKTKLSFAQNDLSNLHQIESSSIDLITSDAVFEHLVQLDVVLKEFKRILKPGGILYSTFGPLWFCWGGDHVSGFDKVENGYNHLILDKDKYFEYLDTMGPYQHNEDDGRTWIKNELFSYLKPDEYINSLTSQGFKKEFVGVILDPRAFECLAKTEVESILKDTTKSDLVTSGMTIIYRKED